MIPIIPSLGPIVGLIVLLGIVAVIALTVVGIVKLVKSRKKEPVSTFNNSNTKQRTLKEKKIKLNSKVKADVSVHESPLSKEIFDTKMTVGKLMAEREKMIANNASNVEISKIDAKVKITMNECDKMIADSEIMVYPKDYQRFKQDVEKYYEDSSRPRILKTEEAENFKTDTVAPADNTINIIDKGTSEYEEKLKLEAAEAAKADTKSTDSSKKQAEEKIEKDIIDELYPGL